MGLALVVPAGARSEVLDRLSTVCDSRDLTGLGARIADLLGLVREDLLAFEEDLARLPTNGESLVERSAEHLLALGGKRLRPTCVMLAARLGRGFDTATCDLAVAVELVHSATLLHDDVVDLGDVRRGEPAARTVYGNAASIFAGDWLLIEALRRVARSRVDGPLERLFDVIEEMIFAESLQLQSRGRIDTDRETWMRVVEGKTASLFRWAMYAGACAGGLSDEACEALERYGEHLGVAFQAVDDVLDFVGDREATGKALFADVSEGKMTWPLIVGMERRPALRPLVQRLVDGANGDRDLLESRIVAGLRESGAVADCMAMARDRASRAVSCLDRVPSGRARDALVTVAEAAVERRK